MNLIRIKNIVVVYGQQNSCKTLSLRSFCAYLLQDKTTKILALKKFGKRKRRNKFHRRDVCLLCEYQGVVTAVCTGGDSADVVLRNFMWMSRTCPSDRNVDIAFLAIRKQIRHDGIGEHCKSLPLLEMEDLEDRHYLNVLRPFIDSGKSVSRLTDDQIITQKTEMLVRLKDLLKRWIAKNAL